MRKEQHGKKAENEKTIMKSMKVKKDSEFDLVDNDRETMNRRRELSRLAGAQPPSLPRHTSLLVIVAELCDWWKLAAYNVYPVAHFNTENRSIGHLIGRLICSFDHATAKYVRPGREQSVPGTRISGRTARPLPRVTAL